ncbi:MAG: hypothetical protein SGILL_009554, partial [Bacillariaceae sp.]
KETPPIVREKEKLAWPEKLAALEAGKDDNPPEPVSSPNLPDTFCVDLKLSEERYYPIPLDEFYEHSLCKPYPSKRIADCYITGLSYAAGSCLENDKVYFDGQDTGLWQCIHEAWQNHWNLRTSPEDWWFPVCRRIAKALITESKFEKDMKDCDGTNYGTPVQDFFLSSSSKTSISVDVPESGPAESEINKSFEAIFDEIHKQVHDAIKCPEYANCMLNDFPTTSTSTHTIVSQINLMESLEEFFEYKINYCTCGLKGVEMLGTVEDWELLKRKFQEMRNLLDPLMGVASMGWFLPPEWWQCVEMVFDNLILARKHPERSGPFWRSILVQSEPEVDRNPYNRERATKKYRDRQKFVAYDGWLVRFLKGDRDTINEKDFKDIVIDSGNPVNEMSGMCQSPLNVTLKWCEPNINEDVRLIGGILGFHCHENDTMNGTPSLQPHHMWAMMVDPSSKLRNLKAKGTGNSGDPMT